MSSKSDSNSSSSLEEICEVERIIGKRISYGEIQYHIKWKDYSSSHNSWEPIDNLDCPSNIDAYEAEHVDEDDSLKWTPKPTKILSSQMIDEKLEYLVEFADGLTTMVALTYGPMKKLIKAYEKKQAKKNSVIDKSSKDEKISKDEKKPTRKSGRPRKADQNENREENITDKDFKEEATDTDNCMNNHGVGIVRNMRRFDGEVKYQVKCEVCDRIEWQPANVLKEKHPQKVIAFYEQCIEWKQPLYIK